MKGLLTLIHPPARFLVLLARRLYHLPPGRHFAVVTNQPIGLDWPIKQTGKGEHRPARLKETAIEDALTGLRFGRYFWVVHVTRSG